MALNAVTWIQIGIFVLCTPYALSVLRIFLYKIKQPSIRERFPFLVLLTGTGNNSYYQPAFWLSYLILSLVSFSTIDLSMIWL